MRVLAAPALPPLIAATVLATNSSASAQTSRIKNVVLVHGAFADGSGWKASAEN